MTAPMIIDTTHGGMYFSIAYLAAFATAAVMMVVYGWKKDYPMTAWLLMLVTGVISFITGEKIFSYSSGEWTTVLTGHGFPASENKMVLGGIISLVAGVCLAKLWLRFDRPVLDSFVVALPLAMAGSGKCNNRASNITIESFDCYSAIIRELCVR